MSEPRFYEPSLDAAGSEVHVAGDEAHHLRHVLRLKPGATLRVFDGRGIEVRAELVAIEKSAAVARVIERVTPAAEPRVMLTLAQSVLKGEKMDAVVRDGTRVGG